MSKFRVSVNDSKSFKSSSPNELVYENELTVINNGLSTKLTQTQLVRLNNYILKVKEALGIASLDEWFDYLYIHANQGNEAWLKNIARDTFHCTKVGSPTYVEYEGFTPVNVNTYLNTNFKSSLNAVCFSKDNGGEGVYFRTKVSNALKVPFGAVKTVGGNKFDQLIPKYAGKYGVAINSSANADTENYTFDRGMYAMFRDSSTAVRGYINSIKLIDKTLASVDMNDLYDFIGVRNLDTLPGSVAEYQVAIKFKGKSMTEIQYLGFLKACDWYMRSLGKSVLPYVETRDRIVSSEIIFQRGVNFLADNAYFRIPVVEMTDNVIIAGCEIRKNGGTDFHISDIGIRRSFNIGEWGADEKIILNNGVYVGDPTHGSRVMNPCILRDGNRIYVFAIKIDDETYTSYYGFIVNPALLQSDWGYIYSDDDGDTWSAWHTLNSLYTAETNVMSCSPGNGIKLTNGTLVCPILDYRHSANTGEGGTDWGIRSGLVYSIDGGMTWQRSNFIPQFTDECQIIEYEPNKIMLFSRNVSVYFRVFTTDDLGNTWIASSEDKLIEGGQCQVSVNKYEYNGVKRFLMCKPWALPRADGRVRITDDLINWGNVYQLVSSNANGYSDICSNSNGDLFVLYESDLLYNIKLFNLSSLKGKLIK